MTRAGRRAALAALVSLAAVAGLGGCATHPPAEAGWISGKLAVRVEADGGEPARSISSDFDLRGDAGRGELRLSTSLGTTVALARWAPGAASLTTAQGEQRFADLDELARQTLGVALPLRALPDWLRGQPWNGAANSANANGFAQLGWQIDTARYGDGFLEVSRAAAPAVSLRARLEKS